MSDFTSEFWNYYVIGVVLIGIIGCAVFLWSQGAATYTIGKTTGHAWDETLEEFNNPLPKWWSWLFYITVVFALGYLVYFPGLGKFAGIGGWTSVKQWEGEVQAADANPDGPKKYSQMPIPAIAADPEAVETGRRLYMTYCVQCHGPRGEGSRGFPNLTDNDWLYGGEPEQIEETIRDGRNGSMTANDYLGEDTIRDLASYVRSFSQSDVDPASANRGRAAYGREDVICWTCHGRDLKGSLAQGGDYLTLGAPNLTDDVWLYDPSEATVIETITKGRVNQMPTWGKFLGPDKVHLLAGYVYSLSHK
ncbi:MAG: cytochrome-c oxidase, cbb3-type subunit III [Zoogloeaceae bacterium]|jgi:cytochrome c oxidase cbb3-type subunit 3|nr:cytochrome-c oxidase, cbb3-type subunit III [Zoogloeaceae bacterium]